MKSKRVNSTDLTLRNLAALKKQLGYIRRTQTATLNRVGNLEHSLETAHRRIAELESRAKGALPS